MCDLTHLQPLKARLQCCCHTLRFDRIVYCDRAIVALQITSIAETSVLHCHVDLLADLSSCCGAQVTEPIRFLMDLPQLNVVMMGKQEPNSSWMPQSTVFLVDLAVQLKLRDPTKDVLRLSALGLGLPLT